jgi:hypothetical protein
MPETTPWTPNLAVNIDATYPNRSAADQQHQADHDRLHAMANDLRTKRLKFGTGSPAGVIDAEPGCIYVDTDATLGARQWIKTGALGDFGGWKVTVGDTGGRRIASTSVTGNTSQPLTGGEILLRRYPDFMVLVMADVICGGISGTQDLTITLATGFRPGNIQPGMFYALTGAAIGGVVNRADISGDNISIIGLTSSTRFRDTKTWPVTGSNVVWPVTLPGVAA